MGFFKRKSVKFALKLAISLLFLWWLFFQLDWQSFLETLSELKFWHILVYSLFYFSAMLVSSWKWQFLAKTKKIDLPLFSFFKYYFGATFINNFMPSFVGGDAYKVYGTGKAAGGKYKEAAASTLFDRVSGLWAAMILALFFGLSTGIILEKQLVAVLNLGILAGLVTTFLLFRFVDVAKILGKFLSAKKVSYFSELLSYAKDKKILTQSFLIAFLFNFLGVFCANYFLFWALGANLAVGEFLAVVFMISIIASAPISINNIGVKEWAYVTLFGLFGVPVELALSVAMISRFIQMGWSFLVLPLVVKSNFCQTK